MFAWLSAVDIIAEFLYPAERVSLKWCCKTTNLRIGWKLIKRGFRTIVLKELRKYLENADLIVNMLSDHKHVLTGSFLLKCISGNGDIIPNDIDLYFIAKTSNQDPFLEKQAQNELKTHDFSQILLENGTIMQGRGEGYTDLPIRSTHYKIDGHPIMTMNLLQIPFEFNYSNTQAKEFLDKNQAFFPEMKHNEQYILRFKSIKDYISKTCDMQFLGNMYDGHTLNVSCWNSIIEKKTTIESFRGIYTRENGYTGCAKFFLHRIHKRIQKYQERGYLFIWKNAFHKNYLMTHVQKCDGECFQICEDGATWKNDSDVETDFEI
jgi:hypothetical protein